MDKIRKHKDKIVIILLVFSLSWAAASAFLFFSDYGRLRRGGFLPGPHAWGLRHGQHVPTANDIDRLASWMTFSFVNNIFNLPPEYLRGELGITSSAYPNITIEAAAKQDGISGATLLTALKSKLNQRISLATATTTQ